MLVASTSMKFLAKHRERAWGRVASGLGQRLAG